MTENEMTKETAMQVVKQVYAQFRGTAQEHQVVQHAIAFLEKEDKE